MKGETKKVKVKFYHSCEYTTEIDLTEEEIKQMESGLNINARISRFGQNPLYYKLIESITNKNILNHDKVIEDAEIIED